MSEDSEKNFHDSTHDESIYGNSSLPKFYATPSERGRTISQDFSEKDGENYYLYLFKFNILVF